METRAEFVLAKIVNGVELVGCSPAPAGVNTMLL